MRRRGRPTLGLTKVLFIRCNRALIEALDRLLAKTRTANPGRVISRADLVRELLYKYLLTHP